MRRKIQFILAALLTAAGITFASAPSPARAVPSPPGIAGAGGGTWSFRSHQAQNFWMAMPAGGTTGTGVVIWNANGGLGANSNFHWTLVDSGEGWWFVVNQQNGLCLYNPDNGGQLTMQQPCSVNYGGMLWRSATNNAGSFYWYCDCGNASYAYITNNGGILRNGNPVNGYRLTGGSYQLWDMFGAA